MRSLVTGATGFLGRRIAEALVERGDEVRALVRDPARSADLHNLGVELVQGDLRDEASLKRAVEGIDRAFHSAALVGDWLDRKAAETVNVGGTRALLDAAAAAGVTRVVHVSSMSVLGTKHHYGTDESAPYMYGDPYTDTKIESERAALAANEAGKLEVAVIRPGFVYGPGDRQILVTVVQALLSGKFAFVGDGGKQMNTVYIDDVANAALLADETPAAAGEAYNITDGQNTTIRDFANFITDELGVPRPTRHVPVRLAVIATPVLETLYHAVRAKNPPVVNRSRLRFLYYNQRYSIEKARRELGFDPKTTYVEGLPRAVAWFREIGVVPAALEGSEAAAGVSA
jgi:nucleoside-diphosphate-sugar epimerase